MGFDFAESCLGDSGSSCANPAWSDVDVRSSANAGSYPKAIALVKDRAVRILIRCADGAVEASVRSESSNDEYAVRIGGKKGSIAKCSCHDFCRRGGLCKHGAAALLVLQNGGASMLPVGTPSSERLRPGAVSTPAKCARTARRTSASGGTVARESVSSKGQLHNEVDDPELEPLPKPQFPRAPAVSTPVAAAPSASTSAIDAKPAMAGNRMGALKAKMTAKLLRAHAAQGGAAAFEAELKRLGNTLLEDAGSLLHIAIVGSSDEGAEAIVAILVARPEVASAVNTVDASGRTALHIAVEANRISICRLLLTAQADVRAHDSKGRTALDLARTRRLDASSNVGGIRQLEDPIVQLLRSTDTIAMPDGERGD